MPQKIENGFVVTKNPHINESLRHEIMKRSKLKNKANKMDIKNDKKQRNYGNYVVQSNKKAKLEYFNTLYQAKGSKSFSVKYKSSFSNKHSKAYTDIILNEKDDNIFKNKEITNTFNEYFRSIVEWLDLHI